MRCLFSLCAAAPAAESCGSRDLDADCAHCKQAGGEEADGVSAFKEALKAALGEKDVEGATTAEPDLSVLTSLLQEHEAASGPHEELEERDVFGSTPLIEAIEAGGLGGGGADLPLVQLLLEHGADPLVTTTDAGGGHCDDVMQIASRWHERNEELQRLLHLHMSRAGMKQQRLAQAAAEAEQAQLDADGPAAAGGSGGGEGWEAAQAEIDAAAMDGGGGGGGH